MEGLGADRMGITEAEIEGMFAENRNLWRAFVTAALDSISHTVSNQGMGLKSGLMWLSRL